MLQVRHLQGIRLLFFQCSKEYCRQGAEYSICSIKHKITTARLGGGFFVFALFTLLSFFLAHSSQNFVNSLWTIINILWTCLQGQLIFGYVAPFSAPHVYSGYSHVATSVSCFSTLQSCNVVVTILGLIVLYYSIQAKLSIYYFSLTFIYTNDIILTFAQGAIVQ